MLTFKRRALTIVRIFCILLFSPDLTHADSGPIYPSGQPTGMAILRANNSAMDRSLYGGSAGAPDNWHFGQPTFPQITSGNPQDFPPLSANNDGSWSAGNGLALIQWYPPASGGQPSWQLAQNGQYLPCKTSDGKILEYDLGIVANTLASPSNPSQYPAAEIPYEQQPNLLQLASYNMHGIYQLVSARYANQNNGCQLNSSNSSVGMIVVNTVSNPHQILFYSIMFSQVCYDDKVPGSLGCPQDVNHPSPTWYWLGAQGTGSQYQVSNDGTQDYGLNDTLQGYGYAQISDNAPHDISLDIRNRVNLIISGGYKGMDPDLSHWKIANPGLQQVTWGNTYLQVKWTGFVPVLTLK